MHRALPGLRSRRHLLLAGLPGLAARLGAASAAPADTTTAAAAYDYVSHAPRTPSILEHLVDNVLEAFNLPHAGNTRSHYAVCMVILALTLALRRVLTGVIFQWLERIAARSRSTLDDRLLPALQPPAVALVTVLGLFTALKVLKLSEPTEVALGAAFTLAFSVVTFWGLLRALDALLDHARVIATQKGLGVAAFMPWIKKTVFALCIVLGALVTADSLGFKVQPFLAGLGIGGLAFALAAQDTLANLFGSLVVAIDQPFTIGEAVKIGSSEGVVEDIGLRSTRLRTLGMNLIVIPNKTVAGEAIVNNSRFTGRRHEQVISLTYDTKAEAMEAMVGEIRGLILAEAEVNPDSVLVYFRDYSASSLDIWMVYTTRHPDFRRGLALRQRVNLGIMRAVEQSGLAFAFPTQTMLLDGPVAKQLAQGRPTAPDGPPPA